MTRVKSAKVYSFHDAIISPVSHESLEIQRKDREPTIHLSRIDWQKEKRGERTIAGDKKRTIKARNEERICQRQLDRERGIDHELSR